MNKENIEKVKKFFKDHPGYLKKSAEIVYYRLASEIDECQYFPVIFKKEIKEIQQKLRRELNQINKGISFGKEGIVCEKGGIFHQLLANEIINLNTTPVTLQYNPKDVAFKPKPRILVFDLETSPNTVFTWRIGNKISIGMDNIIDERKIICIGYKWLGEKETHCINFNIKNQEDKWMLIEFAKVINSAEYILGHNVDAYDLKFLRSRCIKHGIQINPKFNSIDTLKEAKKQFNFNSNKLDYIAQFLGLGAKIHTEYDLWKNIILNKSQDSLDKMITYCKHDVDLTEQVYNKLEPYLVGKKYKYVKR